MAVTIRRRRRRKGISGFFRNLFKERPELLDSTNNGEILDLWQKAHPSRKISKKVKQNLANVKSVMRKIERKGGKRKATARANMVAFMYEGKPTMERLEEFIDECLTMARTLDRSELESVIKRLHAARNEVVWKMGEKK